MRRQDGVDSLEEILCAAAALQLLALATDTHRDAPPQKVGGALQIAPSH